MLCPVTHNGQAAGDGDVDEEEVEGEEEGGGFGGGGGGLESNREAGRMHLVRRWRWFEGITDSDQAAVCPQAEVG